MVYYVFRKSDGLYMGNGITFFDDDLYGCTLTPTPPLDDGQAVRWDGGAWVIV